MGSPFKKLQYIDGRHWLPKILGEKTAASLDFGGQVVGQYDSLYKPANIDAAPSPINDAGAYQARDNIRRRAARAQGQASTIRTPVTAAPYSGTPKSLLGS